MLKDLEGYKRLLLETDRSSNLINYIVSEPNTLVVTDPGVQNLYSAIHKNKIISIYLPEKNRQMQNAADKEAFAKQLAEQVTHGDKILVKKRTDTAKTLQGMMRGADSYRSESGYEITYLALGFLHWKSTQESAVNRSPLLLVPVTLRRNKTEQAYELVVAEERPHMNEALRAAFSENFGIELPNRVETTYKSTKRKVAEVLGSTGAEVVDDCVLLQMKFPSFNIYRDLTEKQHRLEGHPVIRVLLREDREQPFDEAQAKLDNPLTELHNVVDVDASQIHAIEMSKIGKSFVLQGPPGTGKSQTITNIVAECLHDGKTVLFVSEKKAALDFVHHKLEMVGLDDFCLRMHSSRTARNKVISELNRSLQLPVGRVRQQADFEIGRKVEAQERLDAYTEELHKQRPVIEKSLFQLYEIFESLRETDEIPFEIPEIGTRNEEELLQSLHYLEQYVDYIPAVGYDYQCSHWYGYQYDDDSMHQKMKVHKSFRDFAEYLHHVIRICEEIPYILGIPCSTLEEVDKARKLIEFLAKTQLITPQMLQSEIYQRVRRQMETLRDLSKDIRKKEAEIAAHYKPDIYSLDAAGLYKKLLNEHASVIARLFNTEYRNVLTDIQMNRKGGVKPTYAEALDILRDLYELQEDRLAFHQTEDDIKDVTGRLYKGLDTNWDAVEVELALFDLVLQNDYDFSYLSSVSAQKFVAVCKMSEVWNARFEKNDRTLPIDFDFIRDCVDASIIDIDRMPMKKLREWLRGCVENFSEMNNWIRFMKLKDEMEPRGDMDFVRTMVNNLVPEEKFTALYTKQFYRNWIEHVLRSSETLVKFSRESHDRDEKVFRVEDRVQFDISRQNIRAKLSAERPDITATEADSPIAMLMAELQKKQNRCSIRELLDRSGDLIQKIKPCFMMSPTSVSTYLSSGRMQFDTVIFDEASQVLPQEAFGAILRGKQVIIVGDSQQMPPRELPSDPENSETSAREFESILDMGCSTLYQCRLSWHYRSRQEGLIYFSNHHFYDDSLITFPAVDIGTPHTASGVSYRWIEGTFEKKSKTNKEEAAKIIDLIYENITKYPKKSLGVVVMTPEQERLVQRMLDERREQDTSGAEFFEGNNVEPFFIKNMESVQGDERDTIILGVTFGPSTQARAQQTFGMLEQFGGERRLNVAITRAKLQMQVVTSLHAGDVEVGSETPEGVKLLREYLDYAENGPEVLGRYQPVRVDEVYDTYIEDNICHILQDAGFETERGVGYSGNKVDIAVRTKDSSTYFMAIEPDGANYRKAGNARDRDRLRPEALEDMGWKYYRIWTTEWYRNYEVEKGRLLKAVEKFKKAE